MKFKMFNNKPTYVVTRSDRGIITCFPEGFDTSNLKEISTLTSMFAKFINIETGDEYDCETYYNQMSA